MSSGQGLGSEMSFGSGLKNADGSRYYDPASDWNDDGKLGWGDTFSGSKWSDPDTTKALAGFGNSMLNSGGGGSGPPTATAGQGPAAPNAGILPSEELQFVLPLMELVNRARR